MFLPASEPESDRGYASEAVATRFPELYRNHLGVASFVEDWADRVAGDVAHDVGLTSHDQDYLVGYHQALADMAHHLRHGDCLPGGPLYDPDVEVPRPGCPSGAA